MSNLKDTRWIKKDTPPTIYAPYWSNGSVEHSVKHRRARWHIFTGKMLCRYPLLLRGYNWFWNSCHNSRLGLLQRLWRMRFRPQGDLSFIGKLLVLMNKPAHCKFDYVLVRIWGRDIIKL